MGDRGTKRRFDGRVALVTGASRGIGRATAVRLASDGADVAVVYRAATEAADAVCRDVRAAGQKAVAVACDITDRPGVDRAVETVARELGPIDLLVNNAGEVDPAPFDQLTPSHWDRTLAVNLTGAFNLIWAVKTGMLARGFGRIVNVSSIAAQAVRPNMLAYAAAKAGLNSLTKSCCEPLARRNVRINGVAPGVVHTDLVNSLPTDFVSRLEQETPLGRLGQPEEVAGVISFLLSEESSYMTGTTVVISGGRFLMP